MLKIVQAILILSLIGCGSSSDNSSSARGPSQDIKAVWHWQSGAFKLLDLRSTDTLDLSTIDYEVASAGKFFDIYVADYEGTFHPSQKLQVKTDITFGDLEQSFLVYQSMTVMDCDQNISVDCNTAPNAAMAGQGGPWDGSMTYYSDGTTLEVCLDGDCGFYTK